MKITARNFAQQIVLLLSVMAVLAGATPALAASGSHFSRPGSSGPSTADTANGAVGPVPVAAPSSPRIPADAVRIPVGADAQQIVDAHPAGTTFVFASGVHRGVEIGVRSGDTYLGEEGAVLDGTRELDTTSFATTTRPYKLRGVHSDATTGTSDSCAPWYEGGIAQCGHEQEVFRSEQLFADGTRLRHVNTVAEVVDGTWHYDASTATVTVPRQYGQLEMSVSDFAFAGWNSTDVTIRGLHIRGYASPTQMGAIDALGTSGWTVDGVALTGNHGYGVRIGRNMTITNSLITDNGHIGIGGSAEETSFTATGNEIAGNGWLGVQPGFEQGGMKVLFTDGADISRNWVHDNAAKGIWLDGYNTDARIAHNRVERSGQTGILYEISYDAEIVGNTLLDNHTSGDTSESYGNLQIVNSRGVLITGNILRGGGAQELTIYAANEAPGVADIEVRGNDITIDTTWNEGTYGLKDLRADKSRPIPGIVFGDNTLRIASSASRPFAWDSQLISVDAWTAAHGDTVV